MTRSGPFSGVAMVTGSVGNLGAAVALALHAAGARLALVDRGVGRLAKTFPELSGDADHLLLDSIDAASADSMIEAVERTLGSCGRIDALINTVGAFRCGKPVDQADPADWKAMFDTNVGTTVNACRAVIPVMRRQGCGRIVNVASLAALHGEANMAAYCAAKSAVLRLTESLAAELQSDGINVNCVLPSTLDTPQNREAMPGVDRSNWVNLEDVAGVIAFLCSNAARAIRGVAIPLTGTAET